MLLKHRTDMPLDSSNPLAQANTAWTTALMDGLAQAGLQPHRLSDWSFRIAHNKVQLLVGVGVDARASAQQPECRDLTRFTVQLKTLRLFDVGATPLVLDLPPLAETLKGAKAEALVSAQLAEEVRAAPVQPYLDALLGAVA